MIVGEIAGLAAKIAIDKNLVVQGVPYAWLNPKLKARKQKLKLTEVDMDL